MPSVKPEDGRGIGRKPLRDCACALLRGSEPIREGCVAINQLTREKASNSAGLGAVRPRAEAGALSVVRDVGSAEAARPLLDHRLSYLLAQYAVPSFLSLPSLVNSPSTR